MLIGGISFNGCKTPDQKVNDAQIQVENAKENLEKVEDKAAVAEIKAANAEEWKIFKNESEAKIKTNEIRISELKSKIKRSGYPMDDLNAKRVDTLEMQNRKLQSKVDDYNKTMTDWETFKREFNRDMDGLGSALKDFTVKHNN
ncbi:MAG: hypothetical protein B7Y15_11455 [Bacteroidetes bacterium 24-39-8]|jgi:hypothetical protein|nr:MAG: hypothetical protein B7Y76_00985 [Sphingobacteriia bacterium 35-40-5]OYZ48761.1 MAG: hypothetical protein B7Y15_11455 [Bacteroidetes bacterium 24-39-8]OZA68984.1 MAG: hypothetical protein B7X72_00935 [Sphingobacteriia bacterium 39-39-8]